MSETETSETPVKTGKKRFNVQDVCAFYAVDYEKAAVLPWSDRNELINRHYDSQALLRKTAQIDKLEANVKVLEKEKAALSPSVMRLHELLAGIK